MLSTPTTLDGARPGPGGDDTSWREPVPGPSAAEEGKGQGKGKGKTKGRKKKTAPDGVDAGDNADDKPRPANPLPKAKAKLRDAAAKKVECDIWMELIEKAPLEDLLPGLSSILINYTLFS